VHYRRAVRRFPGPPANASHARGDFNGDGRSDILWRNADGTISNWLVDANLSFGAFALAGPSPPGRCRTTRSAWSDSASAREAA
jgi:hypothetical protein